MEKEKTTKDEKGVAGSCPAAMTGYVDLLPCPFCGGEATITEEGVTDGITEDIFYIASCSQCPCLLGEGDETKKNAIKAWNTRAT